MIVALTVLQGDPSMGHSTVTVTGGCVIAGELELKTALPPDPYVRSLKPDGAELYDADPVMVVHVEVVLGLLLLELPPVDVL